MESCSVCPSLTGLFRLGFSASSMLLQVAGFPSFSIAYIYHIFFIHSSVDRHFGSFYILAIVNSASVNLRVLIPLWNPDFNSCRYMSRNRVAGWHGSSIFNFLRNLHTSFHSGCTILYSYQQCASVPISPHSLWHLLSFAFLIIAI